MNIDLDSLNLIFSLFNEIELIKLSHVCKLWRKTAIIKTKFYLGRCIQYCHENNIDISNLRTYVNIITTAIPLSEKNKGNLDNYSISNLSLYKQNDYKLLYLGRCFQFLTNYETIKNICYYGQALTTIAELRKQRELIKNIKEIMVTIQHNQKECIWIGKPSFMEYCKCKKQKYIWYPSSSMSNLDDTTVCGHLNLI